MTNTPLNKIDIDFRSPSTRKKFVRESKRPSFSNIDGKQDEGSRRQREKGGRSGLISLAGARQH